MVRITVAAILALATSVLAIEASEAARVGKGNGDQFITGACASDADCAAGCCAADTGKCAAPLVAQERAGCGFVGNGLAQGNGNGQQGGRRQRQKQAQQAQQAQEDNFVKRRVAQPLRA